MATKKKVTTTPTTATTTETKSAKFLRLANARMPGALKRIGHIANLGGPGYESTEEQRAKIVKALRDAVDMVETKLNGTKSTTTPFAL